MLGNTLFYLPNPEKENMYVVQPNQAFGCIFFAITIKNPALFIFCATKIAFLSEMIYDFL